MGHSQKNISNLTKSLKRYPQFFQHDLQVWANNGDYLSQCYTGTAALKSDFTRSGTRNIAGVAQDAFKSLNRLYNNNLKDSFRQLAIDLVLGNVLLDEVLAEVQAGGK